MTLSVSISTPRLLTECTEQTSHDFKAMRLSNPDTTDALYDDFVMTDDIAADLIFPIEEFGADMAHALRTLMKMFSAGRDVIYMDIDCANESAGSAYIAESFVRQYYKYRILAWWYTSRDTNLATLYTEKAGAALDNLFTHCMPHSGTSIPHYF